MASRLLVQTRPARNAPPPGAAVLSVDEVRSAERAAAPDGAAMLRLMERSGEAAARALAAFAGRKETLVLCGPGNNGGDGYVVAAALAVAGWAVRVAGDGPPRSEPARTAAARWAGPVERIADARPAPVLVDALFGTGLTRTLDDAYAAALARLAGGACVIALDLPSRLEADSGACLGAALFSPAVRLYGLGSKPNQQLDSAAVC